MPGEDIAERVRACIDVGDAVEIREMRMFGGVGFMVNGNLACAAGKSDLLVRVDTADRPALLSRPETRAAIMGKREMKNWVEVDTDELDDPAFAEWVGRGVAFALGLPPK